MANEITLAELLGAESQVLDRIAAELQLESDDGPRSGAVHTSSGHTQHSSVAARMERPVDGVG